MFRRLDIKRAKKGIIRKGNDEVLNYVKFLISNFFFMKDER